MATEPTTEMMKAICQKADLLFAMYASMRTLLETNGDKLDREWETNPAYRQARDHLKPIKNEANPEQLPQFELAKFLDPKSPQTFQLFADEIDAIRTQLAGAMSCFNRTLSTFDMVSFNRFPSLRSEYKELLSKITYYMKVCQNIRKILI